MNQIAELEAIRRSEELKSTILASLSHDLRSPLTAIEASASSLRAFRDQLPQDVQQDMLGNIIGQCARLNRYAANLLSLGMIEGGIGEASLEEVDLVEILASALSRVAAGFPSARIARRFDVTSAPVRAHPVMLEQMIYNITENACLHGGGAITVAVRQEPDAVVLIVEDDGPGIPAKFQKSVFQRFYRAQSDQKIPGTGLGLYITSGFAKAFGGSVSLASPAQEGRGTRIEVRIPALCPVQGSPS